MIHSGREVFEREGGGGLVSISVSIGTVSLRHRGGRIQKINAWYLNTHMVYL
jgi:hypothetical protein